MSIIKQATRYIMPIEFDIDLDNVSQIEFKFTQSNSVGAPALKTAVWVNGETGTTARRIENTCIIQVLWENNETFLFKRDADFYLDTRITIIDTDLNPPTPIVKLHMSPSLFEKDEVITDD